MYSYTSVLLYIVLAEVLRRWIKILLTALTGPLSKVPGPFIYKFSSLPWARIVLQGNQINESPKLFAKFGDVVRIAPDQVAVCSKNACYRILVEDDLKKGPAYKRLVEDGVTNLFTERDNAAYKQKRRILSTGFSISYINGLEPLMQECIQEFVEALQNKCTDSNGSAVVDFSRLLANLTFVSTSLSSSFELTTSGCHERDLIWRQLWAHPHRDSKIRKMFQDRLLKVALRSLFPILKYIPFEPLLKTPEFDVIDRIVSKRRKAMETGEEKRDLLQIFLNTHDAHPDEFTYQHLREEMRLFMIAGSDTTSVTATFTIILLLQNPLKLKLLLSEIDSAFPNIDDEITFSTTQNLPYLNACVNESMRVIPTVRSGLQRVAEERIVLDGFEIPPGTSINAFIDATMCDPRIWSAADQFMPERWLQEGEVDRKAFIPFSAGLRNCIGQQFALKELRLILVMLLKKFDLKYVEGQNYEMRVHTVPYLKQRKYLVGVKPRV